MGAKKTKKKDMQATVSNEAQEMIVSTTNGPVVLIPNTVTKLTIDYGREDLNTMAMKINEIIDFLNDQI